MINVSQESVAKVFNRGPVAALALVILGGALAASAISVPLVAGVCVVYGLHCISEWVFCFQCREVLNTNGHPYAED